MRIMTENIRRHGYMKVCEKVLEYLKKNDILTAFGIPSATICPIVDAFNDFKDMEYIITKNEVSAAYSACKFAKVSGKIGLLLVSGSVGIANAMNGIAEAMDSKLPVLIIGGYVDSNLQGLGAAQEVEGERYVSNFVKYSKVVNNESDILSELQHAIYEAYTYPRGVVHIGIPLNVQKQEYTGEDFPEVPHSVPKTNYNSLIDAVSAINESKNGLLFIGGGCRGFGDKIKKLAERLNWRIIYTPSGKGIVEDNFHLNMGYYGMPVTDLSVKYVADTDIDCIVALGTRLGECSTQCFTENLKKGKLIHVDADESVFNKAYNEDVQVVSHIGDALDYFLKNVQIRNTDNSIKEHINAPAVYKGKGLLLRNVLEKLPEYVPYNTFYISDIGSLMLFVETYLKVPKGGAFECNLNYGAMGSSTGAIGISRVYPDRPIVQFVGDGGFFMNVIGELMTYKKYNLRIVCIVVNNHNLRFVDDGHKALFGRSIPGFMDEPVDISNIASAFGVKSLRLEHNSEIPNMKKFLADIDQPLLIELVVDDDEPIPTNRFKSLKNTMNRD
jgi:acetolactate synthase-1/2/3 large subunit